MPVLGRQLLPAIMTDEQAMGNAAYAWLTSVSSTLRRHLDNEQTSYHALIETVRFRHAQLLLARPELSVDAIALQLDFTDAANFRRAFKRWSGKTPAAWKQEN